MIRGAVSAGRQPAVLLPIRGPAGATFAVDFVIDTGFVGPLIVPQALAAALGLVPESDGSAVMADGSACRFDVCRVEVRWDGVWRTVDVGVTGTTPLLGMRLLAGHELRVECDPGGAVEITPSTASTASAAGGF